MEIDKKKINELYITKKVTLMLPKGKNLVPTTYVVTRASGTDMELEFELRAITTHDVKPEFQMIFMRMENEYPNTELRKRLKAPQNNTDENN